MRHQFAVADALPPALELRARRRSTPTTASTTTTGASTRTPSRSRGTRSLFELPADPVGPVLHPEPGRLLRALFTTSPSGSTRLERLPALAVRRAVLAREGARRALRRLFNFDLELGEHRLRALQSSGDLAIGKVGIENPGLVDFDVFSVGAARRGSSSVELPSALPFRAMGSPCELRLVRAGPRRRGARCAPRRRRGGAARAKYSRYRDDSLTSRINRSAGDAHGRRGGRRDRGACSTTPRRPSRQSDGRFDLTSGILRRAWDFSRAGCPRAGRDRRAAAAGRLAAACAGSARASCCRAPAWSSTSAAS